MVVLYDVPLEVEIVHIEVGAFVKLREYLVYSAAITFKHLIGLFLSLGYGLKDRSTLALLHLTSSTLLTVPYDPPTLIDTS